MALIFRGKTECSLCGNVIMAGDEIVATFVAKYNRLVGGITFGNGTFHQMEPDGSIAVLKRSE